MQILLLKVNTNIGKMLTIKGISNTGLKEFKWAGYEWVLYGIDTTSLEYRFIFIRIK